MMPGIEFVDWGPVDYTEALDRQHALFNSLIARKTGESSRCNQSAGRLVLCEHPHVYTLGRSGRVENLLVSEAQLAAEGASLRRIERGGDITYHGPGQIVGYPILDLDRLGLGLREYIAAIEQAVIETCAEFGVTAGRTVGKTGVWVCDKKICAIGVRASRGVVMHGFALNVSTDLGRFDRINPCGMPGIEATSIEKETGCKIALAEVKKALCGKLCDNLGVRSRLLNSD